MSYATTQHLIDRYGDTEIARLSAAYGAEVAVDAARCEVALGIATALVDSYLRARYQVPLADPPLEVVSAVLTIARHELAQGDGREPTTQMIEARKETVAWLGKVADGKVLVAGASSSEDGSSVPDAAGADSGACVQDREPMILSGRYGGIV
jgi:phage gp36-like protein